MSAITLNLPDDLVVQLKGRKDLDQFATNALRRELEEDDDLTPEIIASMETGIAEARRGEGVAIETFFARRKAEREARQMA
jgi:hypothetical protein